MINQNNLEFKYSNTYSELPRIKPGILWILGFWFYLMPNYSSQNLIPNSSFENNSGIINGCSQFTNCQNWYSGFGTPDYYSTFASASCNCGGQVPHNNIGFQFPKSGNHYVGIINRSMLQSQGYPNFSNAFELLGVQLQQALQANHVYDFSLYYSLPNGSTIVNNQLSAYFSSTAFILSQFSFNPLDVNWYNSNINNINPQINNDTAFFLNADTLNWTLLNGCFVANGSEKYVTIGNFRDGRFNKIKNSSTNFPYPCNDLSGGTYLYIDDVSLYDLGYYSGAANCLKDTLICPPGGKLSIGNNIADSSQYAWQPSTGLSCTNCPNPLATVTTTTKYYLTKTLGCIVSKDSVTIKIFDPNESVSAGTSTIICSGTQYTLGASPNPNYTCQWQPITGLSCTNCATPVVTASNQITYTVTRSVCGFSNNASVTISLKPEYTLTPKVVITNTIHCLSDTLNLIVVNAPSNGNPIYNWQPGSQLISSSSLSVNALIRNDSYYSVLVSNNQPDYFCPYNKKDSIFVSLRDTCQKAEILIPDIFTPNNDNVNDEWKIKLPTGYKFKAAAIYDRWGTLIYGIDDTVLNSEKSKIRVVRWDGRTSSGLECSDGIYFYVLIYSDRAGEIQKKNGSITLVR